MLNTELNQFKTPTASPFLVKLAIGSAIVKRSSELVAQLMDGKITLQAYHAMQFPADAISYLEKHIDEEIASFEAGIEEAKNAP